jgi:uncharacterized phage protein gp47/JayE
MSFRRRGYPEVLDNLLTQMIGGVAAEAHPFPPPGTGDGAAVEHQLEQPKARSIVSVYGLRNGQSHRFAADACELLADGQTVRWRTGADLPDEGTLVHLNYLREDEPPTLTDLQVGSVVRTLTESVALEIARLNAQLQAVYEAGFIDTASGSALEKVVALLGLERVGAERASAKGRFERASGSKGSIAIVAGTRIIDARARVEYATTETATMAPGQSSITVSARDQEPANDPVAADTLTVLPIPIAGVARVTNPAPATRAARAESDAELRERARNFLYGSERATLGALSNVLARQQVRGEVTEDVSRPGFVTVVPVGADLTPERRAQIDADLQANRPAGVFIDFAAAVVPASVALDIRLTTAAGLTESDLRAAHASVDAAIRDYFERLPIREDAKLSRLIGLALAVDGVEDVDIQAAQVTADGAVTDGLDVTAGIIRLADAPSVLGALNIADPALPSQIDVVVRFPVEEAAADAGLMESAVLGMTAYLNSLADQAGVDPAHRRLSLGKVLWALPLPGKPGDALQAFDEAAVPPTLPLLADVAPY